MTTIAFQTEFRPALPVVYGAKDYREFRATLEEIDHILTATGLEDRMLRKHLAMRKKTGQKGYKRARQALRYALLLALTGLPCRILSHRVADSVLFQWFTHTSEIDGVRPVSKSTIERYEKTFSRAQINQLIHDCNTAVSNEAGARALLYSETELAFDEIFADTTCVKNNIHYPVDWLLLRDAARTLTKAIALIRDQGLKHRIRPPQKFLEQMNRLCIEMTHVRKTKGAKKKRKAIFRNMKQLIQNIVKHARRYYDMLAARWAETTWGELEAQVVLNRMQGILTQLPQAIRQAHERIIGERRVQNKDKILSLYEPDVRVIVRGKADAEVEFGNGLYLAEQADGLIVDWHFIQEQPPGDMKLVKDSLQRLTKIYGSPTSYAADRGFDAEDNRDKLAELGIVNGICPRSVPLLQERLEDDEFTRLQKRRAATEARMGIFKNVYLGEPLRSKGFAHRALRIEWCILAHNLWKLGRMAADRREAIQLKKAA